MKSYFDPVLEKDQKDRKNNQIIISNLKLINETVILYNNYEKVSSIHIYKIKLN